MENTLYIVVPCYNEQEVLNETAKRLSKKLDDLISRDEISKESKVLFVDDGSKDNTFNMIKSLAEENKFFKGVKLSRNRGHQNALLAGLMEAKEHCSMAISMDADLQDDIDAVDKMVAEYKNGSDVVYGVRSSRKKDTFFKRTTAQSFYKLLEKFGVDVIYNHADYRLLSKRALYALSEFKEVNLFLRGIVPLIGYRFSIVEYKRGERFAGESKYPLKKMLSLAFDGITSFSVKPIKLITSIGVVSAVISMIALIIFIILNIMSDISFMSYILLSAMFFIMGVLMVSIGIVGEYVGKIYMEVKARPRYIIEEKI